MTQPLLTVEQAAELLGVSVSSMWVLLRNGQIASVQIPSAKSPGSSKKMRRIEQAEIAAFIKRNRAQAVS